MAVSLPQKNGATFEVTPEGATANVVYLVEYPNGDPDTVLDDVTRVGGVPRLGDPYRSRPEIQVVSVRAEPHSTNKYKVSVRYDRPPQNAVADRDGRYGPISWTAGSRLISETTRRDANGKLMRVFYSGTPKFELVSANSGETFIGSTIIGNVTGNRFAEADVDRALLQLSATRWERDNPMPKAIAFGICVNADQWLTMAPKTVLYEGVQYEEEDDGWRVQYTFTFNPRGWAVENAIKINGQTPIDATVGNGVALHDLYPAKSFAALELRQ